MGIVIKAIENMLARSAERIGVLEKNENDLSVPQEDRRKHVKNKEWKDATDELKELRKDLKDMEKRVNDLENP